MKGEKREKNAKYVRAGRECAYIAVFVALVIASQLALAFAPGVELVTLLFVSYSFAFGHRRGMISATAFALLRQLVFGFFPTVLILYLVYYNLLALTFGLLGKRVKRPARSLWWLVIVACVCTAAFTLIDNVLTPLWYGYTEDAARAYFLASLPVLIPQLVCTAVTVGLLFIPIEKLFEQIGKGLR